MTIDFSVLAAKLFFTNVWPPYNVFTRPMWCLYATVSWISPRRWMYNHWFSGSRDAQCTTRWHLLQRTSSQRLLPRH